MEKFTIISFIVLLRSVTKQNTWLRGYIHGDLLHIGKGVRATDATVEPFFCNLTSTCIFIPL